MCAVSNMADKTADKTMDIQRQTLVRVEGLRKSYERGSFWSRHKNLIALRDVDLEIAEGSSMALVGESGSGKSTLARCLARMEEPTGGEIWFDGQNLLTLRGEVLFRVRCEIQLVFQDSATALNPRFSAEEIISEPLAIQGESAKKRKQVATEWMERIGLPGAWLQRRPHVFSGGQRQRLAIARALVIQPRLLILDEALAGLDLSVQAQIVNLLLNLQTWNGLTCLYISHDLGLMGAIADEIAVMHDGQIVERQTTRQLFAYPQHIVTQGLLAAIPGRNLDDSAPEQIAP